jgi:NitT/TauT family transport system ATP-binding protein
MAGVEERPRTAGLEAHTRAAAIEFRAVTKRFRLESGEEIEGVREVSLTVRPGEFVCIVGPSGHGKSTLLNLAAGFIEPTIGQVVVNGEPVRGPGADRGVVFQRDTLFLWRRVADNIAFGMAARGVPRHRRDEVVAEYLRVIGLERFARAWPKQLSGGMRRRVAIAAVFANDPEVLLMDEPFVGLDYVRRAALHDVLLRLWSELRRTVLFITHDVDEALALGDRLVIMTNGTVQRDVPITLPRPRTAEILTDEVASALRLEVWSAMEAAVNEA